MWCVCVCEREREREKRERDGGRVSAPSASVLRGLFADISTSVVVCVLP